MKKQGLKNRPKSRFLFYPELACPAEAFGEVRVEGIGGIEENGGKGYIKSNRWHL